MQARPAGFKPQRTLEWTRERIDELDPVEIEQLRANAETLGKTAIATLCEEALRVRPQNGAKRADAPAARSKPRKGLISRAKAFEARGVFLQDARGSWSGVRKSDGVVVISIWASDIQSQGGGCRYLLWAPNVEGAHPWSDKPAGKERLEHCRLAHERGSAEGLLVHGERLDGHIPEDRARTVQGVDPETVVHFNVEQRGKEYWAVWGKKSA